MLSFSIKHVQNSDFTSFWFITHVFNRFGNVSIVDTFDVLTFYHHLVPVYLLFLAFCKGRFYEANKKGLNSYTHTQTSLSTLFYFIESEVKWNERIYSINLYTHTHAVPLYAVENPFFFHRSRNLNNTATTNYTIIFKKKTFNIQFIPYAIFVYLK